MAAKKQVIEFERENPTKNKQRFREVSDPPMIGVLYVAKKIDEKLGTPENLTVTLEAK